MLKVLDFPVAAQEMKSWVHEMDSIYDNIVQIPKLQKNQTVEPFLTRHGT